MKYTSGDINALKAKLLDKATDPATSEGCRAELFAAYEVIVQLQKSNNPVAHVMRLDLIRQVGPYEMDEVALFNGNHLTEDEAWAHIQSGEYSPDLLILPEKQWQSLFLNQEPADTEPPEQILSQAKTSLPELVRSYRKEKGLSLRAFASKCGLSSGYMSMLERGRNPKTGKPIDPMLSQLKKLAFGMEMSIEDLVQMI